MVGVGKEECSGGTVDWPFKLCTVRDHTFMMSAFFREMEGPLMVCHSQGWENFHYVK